MDGPSPTGAVGGASAGEVAPTVAAVALPEVAVDQSKSNFIAAVTTSAIDGKNKLVGFQGDSPSMKEWSPSKASQCKRLE